MFGDDDLDSGGARLSDGVNSRDAAIAGQDERRTDPFRFGQPGAAEVVSIGHSVRQEWMDIGAGGTQRTRQDRRCALAVYVVIAMHQDAFFRLHRCRDDRDGLRHAGEAQRIGECFERWSQEGFGCVRITEAALHEERRERQRQREGDSQGTRRRRIRR
jgi:hypothetical protein